MWDEKKFQLSDRLLELLLGETACDLGPCVSLWDDVGCISKILRQIQQSA